MNSPSRFSAVQSLWMLGAGLSFALMTQCVKAALDSIGILELVWYRTAGGTLLMFALLLVSGKPMRPRHYQLHLWRAGLGIIAFMMFFYAIGRLPPSVAYGLNYTSPLFFIILAVVVLREPTRPIVFVPVIGSFVGVLLLLRPDPQTASYLPSLLGVLSGLCAAMAFVMVRKLGGKGEGGMRTVFFFNLNGGVITLAALLLFGEWVGITHANWLPVLGLVVLATTGQLALTRALHLGNSAVGAALSYSGILFSLLLDTGPARHQVHHRRLRRFCDNRHVRNLGVVAGAHAQIPATAT